MSLIKYYIIKLYTTNNNKYYIDNTLCIRLIFNYHHIKS